MKGIDAIGFYVANFSYSRRRLLIFVLCFIADHSYVLKNKKEWERKGRQVVQEMVLLYKDVEDEDASGSSFDSEDYDSDDLEYDSPGDMSSSEEEVESAEVDKRPVPASRR